MKVGQGVHPFLFMCITFIMVVKHTYSINTSHHTTGTKQTAFTDAGTVFHVTHAN